MSSKIISNNDTLVIHSIPQVSWCGQKWAKSSHTPLSSKRGFSDDLRPLSFEPNRCWLRKRRLSSLNILWSCGIRICPVTSRLMLLCAEDQALGNWESDLSKLQRALLGGKDKYGEIWASDLRAGESRSAFSTHTQRALLRKERERHKKSLLRTAQRAWRALIEKSTLMPCWVAKWSGVSQMSSARIAERFLRAH